MTSIDGLCNSADLMIDGKKVEEAESVLDIDALVEESVQGIYTRKIVPGQTEFDFA